MTYKEKLRPAPAQVRILDGVLVRYRTLYNTALEQRITAWQSCRVSVTRYQQKAELKDIRATFPDYAAIHSHVLQGVLARLDKTYQAFFLDRDENAARNFQWLGQSLPGVPALAGALNRESAAL